METAFTILFVSVLLSIPVFLGRGLYRAFATRKRIEGEAPKLTFASAQIVGFTKQANTSDHVSHDHFAIVEYTTADGDVIWAETLPCDKQQHEVGDVVNVICRPGRARSVMIAPSTQFASGQVGFEKNLEIVLVLVGICILIGVAIRYHGLSLPILGTLFVALCAGFAFGYLTRGWGNPDEKADLEAYRRRSDRLKSAQAQGVIPCLLQE